MQNNQKGKLSIKFVAYTGLMTAIVYVCTLIGVSTPVANFNIGDSAILITAAMFNPLTAMIAGGLGAFLADLTTYPATMLYTLVIKAIEGLVAGIAFTFIYKRFDKIENPTKKDVALKIVFATITCVCCTAFMYGTMESALTSLPKNIVQALVSTLIAMLVLYAARLEKVRPKTQLVLKAQKQANAEAAEDESPIETETANTQTEAEEVETEEKKEQDEQ
mgnify:CR=1 FL=1